MKPITIGSKIFAAAAIAAMLGGCDGGAAAGSLQQSAQPAPSGPPASAAAGQAGSPAESEPAAQAATPQPAQAPGGQRTASPVPAEPAPAVPQPAATPASAEPAAAAAIEHVVIVVEENHSYNQIVGNAKQAPYMNKLISEGALLTNSFGVAHPSQPNYLALFSGSTQGVTDDSCGPTFKTANLASELLQKKLTFVGYSEDLPKAGFTGCSSKGYARKHNPWAQFTNVPAELNQPLSAFPQHFGELPTVSFVIPNHQDDMHDGTVQQADTWLKDHLQPYVEWAKTNRSLLIVTWDEDDNSKQNHIPTIFVGPMVKPGKYAERIDHYGVLRTIEDAFHITPIGESAKAAPLTTLWTK